MFGIVFNYFTPINTIIPFFKKYDISSEMIIRNRIEKSAKDEKGIINLDFVANILTLGCMFGVSYYLSSYILTLVAEKLIAKQATSRELAKKLNRPELVSLQLTSYEARIANDTVVASDELTTTFNDIGGMADELENIIDNIVLPINLWKAMQGQSNIAPCPLGVLMFGKPGTGKTLTARALAKAIYYFENIECQCTFLQVTGSALLDKWFGESNKLVTALFSLARKLAPTIIFIDEIEAILRKRGGSDHVPALDTLQSGLLSEWDGLKSISDLAGPVLVVGATNRPDDIDPAFLRRLPVLVRTNPPDRDGRIDILSKMLRNEALDETVDISTIADLTENFTGSDLREVVRAATIKKAKNILNNYKQNLGNTSSKNSSNSLSYSNTNYSLLTTTDFSNVKLSMDDFYYALNTTKKSENVAKEYRNEADLEDNQEKIEKFVNLMKSLKQ